MESKMTAVEWLVEELNKSTSLTSFVPECNENYKQEILGIIQQAKEMEKEQIMKAYKDNNYARYVHDSEVEQYYNETYGKGGAK